MEGKREAKKADLKKRLLQAASEIIESEGVAALNARTVTKKADCALGSLYTAFEDLNDLITHVNSQTLRRLGEELAAEAHGIEEPVSVLKALASGYLRFARENFALWNALFEYAALSLGDIPEWHQEEQAVLVNFIEGPVKMLSPDLPEDEAATRAKTLFASVHGIIIFSLQDRYIGLPQEDLEDELMRFIDQMLDGLFAVRES